MSTPWSRNLGVIALVVLIIGGAAFLFRFGTDSTASPGGGSPIVNPTVNEMAQATVHILGLDAEGQPMCSGSGTFVASSGMILTNAHVVTRDVICDFSTLGVAVTTDSGRPPELLYKADLLVADPEVDLAVIKVAAPLSPDRELPSSFPALEMGDSDELMIGDNIRILGYPEIGGETITFTNGSVSGFTAQAGIGDRALIKTDATIAGGNSGGAAVDSQGRLIGIPTKARASESGPAVDCRPLADTNADGAVDDADNCVPIGGFLNGIRPINLARSLIEQARGADPQPLERDAAVKVDLSTVSVTNPRFSTGENGDKPTEEVLTATAGIAELCLFVDWSGIPDGAEWDGLWYKDQEVIKEYSLVEQSWKFGTEGANFWMCAKDHQSGLGPGLYELGFFLDGELVFAEGIVLTSEPAEIITTTWRNEAGVDVCGLAINPQGSGPVGLNELAPEKVIPPGETIELDLPQGEVVVEAYDCEGRAIADSAGSSISINSNGDAAYSIKDPTAS